jgi:hypothetical protein
MQEEDGRGALPLTKRHRAPCDRDILTYRDGYAPVQ